MGDTNEYLNIPPGKEKSLSWKGVYFFQLRKQEKDGKGSGNETILT